MRCRMVKPTFDWGNEFDKYLKTLSVKDEAKFRALIDRVENTDYKILFEKNG